MKRLLFPTCILLLAGCSGSSKLSRPMIDVGLAETAEDGEPFRGPGVGIEKGSDLRISEEQIQLALKQLGPLEGPVRLAVVEIRPSHAGREPRSLAPEQLDSFRESLGDSVDSVQTIPQMFLPHVADLPSLRYAAARIGANVVFLFGRADDTDVYFNAWSNLNWFILPIFTVPGKTVEVYAAAEGALVDVATSRVRAVAAADIRLDSDLTTAASSTRTREELRREAELQSLKTLGASLAREITTLRAAKK